MMNFELDKYLGKWFEIARIKNIFEPNMTNVTANYSLKENGDINVVNEGYINKIPLQIVGTAKTTNVDKELKVSFFNNIYSIYKILFIDENYQYALVGGKKPNNLWVLSRTKEMNKTMLQQLTIIAKEKGYDTNKLTITRND